MTNCRLIYLLLLFGFSSLHGLNMKSPMSDATKKTILSDLATKIPRALNEDEWESILSRQEFYILRLKGTEKRWTSKLLNVYKTSGNQGVFSCAACNNELFSIDAKFNSRTGWPSFYKPINDSHVEYEDDRKLGYIRTEVRCAKCGGHLGHVFRDGPRPTGLRYCINGEALKYK